MIPSFWTPGLHSRCESTGKTGMPAHVSHFGHRASSFWTVLCIYSFQKTFRCSVPAFAGGSPLVQCFSPILPSIPRLPSIPMHSGFPAAILWTLWTIWTSWTAPANCLLSAVFLPLYFYSLQSPDCSPWILDILPRLFILSTVYSLQSPDCSPWILDIPCWILDILPRLLILAPDS